MSTFVTQTEIKEWGNSLAMRIPRKIKEALNLQNGSQINISIDGNKVVLEAINNPFFHLSADTNLLSIVNAITTQNKHSSEEFNDNVVGDEIW